MHLQGNTHNFSFWYYFILYKDNVAYLQHYPNNRCCIGALISAQSQNLFLDGSFK